MRPVRYDAMPVLCFMPHTDSIYLSAPYLSAMPVECHALLHGIWYGIDYMVRCTRYGILFTVAYTPPGTAYLVRGMIRYVFCRILRPTWYGVPGTWYGRPVGPVGVPGYP